MADVEFPTSLGTSQRDRITLLGHDLATELIGQVSLRRAGVLAGRAAPAVAG